MNFLVRFFILFISLFSFSQQHTKVTFISVDASLFPNAIEKSISGNLIYHCKILQSIDTIRIDAKNMTFTDVKINNKPINYKNNTKELLLFEGFKKGKNTITFTYKATPKQALYFIGNDENLQIWTQGQGKYTSNWLPSFDDVNQKIIFNIAIQYDKNFEVLANGKLANITYNNVENSKTWSYKMQKPMSSYLLMMAIGNFIKKEEISQKNIALQWYLDKNDASKFEPTYRYSKEIFDFLNAKIGIKFPWKTYKQVPVKDFLYAGMENTSATIFAQEYVVDSIGFNDKNYVYVNAHELAHQWFGDMITAKNGQHHWLQEGFATYYGMLAERKIFGDDYFYNKLYRNANLIKNAAKTDTIPVMNAKASSLSFYEKGAWALHYLHDKVGDKTFDKIVKKYLKKHQFKNVETNDFLDIVSQYSNLDVQKFKQTWLLDYNYPAEEINYLLQKNQAVQQLLKVQKLKNQLFKNKKDELLTILKSDSYYSIKVEIINQLKDVSFDEKQQFINLAMQSNDIKIRQAVASSIEVIPINFKKQYETLLNDASYETRQIAFQNLWNNFEQSHDYYLSIAKKWLGANDKSLQIMYLGYVQLSRNSSKTDKDIAWQELQNFTSSNYESTIRQNAFEMALSINKTDKIVLKNLVNFTTSFRWQFSGFAKETLKQLAIENDVKTVLQSFNDLSENEKFQLQKILAKK